MINVSALLAEVALGRSAAAKNPDHFRKW